MDDLDCRPQDEDIRLAGFFIPDAGLRADIWVLQAFLEQLRLIPQRAHEPMMAEIRLAWWREGLEALAEGKVDMRHPLFAALRDIHFRRPLEWSGLINMCTQQACLFESPLDASEVLALIEASECEIARQVSPWLAPGKPSADLRPILIYSAWSNLCHNAHVTSPDNQEIEVLQSSVQSALRRLPNELVPIILPVALAKYRFNRREVGPLARRFRLLCFFINPRL